MRGSSDTGKLFDFPAADERSGIRPGPTLGYFSGNRCAGAENQLAKLAKRGVMIERYGGRLRRLIRTAGSGNPSGIAGKHG
jgi:hypothetical protein